MNKFKFPVIWTACALFAFLAFIGVYWLTNEQSASLESQLFTLSRRASAQPKLSLQDASEQDNLTLARDRARKFRDALLQPKDAEPIIAEVAKLGWEYTEAKSVRNTEYVSREFHMRHPQCSVEDWPKIRDAVRVLSTHQGVRIQSLTIEATGDESHPVFTRMEMTALIYLRANPQDATVAVD